jgi:hypothetical protein
LSPYCTSAITPNENKGLQVSSISANVRLATDNPGCCCCSRNLLDYHFLNHHNCAGVSVRVPVETSRQKNKNWEESHKKKKNTGEKETNKQSSSLSAIDQTDATTMTKDHEITP